MIYLHKILPFLLSPLVLAMLLLAVGVITKKKRYGLIGLILLYGSSTFIVADFLFESLEGRNLKKQAQQAKPADAIVVLSGMLVHVNSISGPVPEWGDADRFFAGVDLYQMGKAPRLIFTGGVLPWEKSSESEGEILRSFALRMGIPENNISVTHDAQNTQQEVHAVKDLLGEASILLVTSAFHMPRAQRQFEAQGFKVEAFPVDFKVRARALTPMDFMPNPSALGLTDVVVREWLGRFYYWVLRSL
jgi:uncharacterized SAM-binding protein YcdF (DUF218 family)